jgi:hypothetical protein
MEVNVNERERLQIFINGKAYHVNGDDSTGAQIKALGDIPVGDILYRLSGEHRHEVGDTERIELHEGERFVSVPQVGGAS